MSNSIFKSGLKVSKIEGSCTFSMLFLKSKFKQIDDLYMIHYTEDHKIYTIVSDGERFIKSPVTLRVSLGKEISNISRFLDVIERAFISTDAIVFDKDEYEGIGILR